MGQNLSWKFLIDPKNVCVFVCANHVKLCVELDNIECRRDFEGKEVIEDGLNSLYQPMTIEDRFRSSN